MSGLAYVPGSLVTHGKMPPLPSVEPRLAVFLGAAFFFGADLELPENIAGSAARLAATLVTAAGATTWKAETDSANA